MRVFRSQMAGGDDATVPPSSLQSKLMPVKMRQKVKDDFHQLQISHAEDEEEAARRVFAAKRALSSVVSGVASSSFAQSPAAAAAIVQANLLRTPWRPMLDAMCRSQALEVTTHAAVLLAVIKYAHTNGRNKIRSLELSTYGVEG